MLAFSRISEVFYAARQIPFDDSSKLIIMSDCHRGDGSWADNFLNNQNIYFAALSYYYEQGFTYIELGDGDELWENSKFCDIVSMHRDVFWLLSEFMKENRLYLLFGNHDMIKKNQNIIKKSYCVNLRAHEKWLLFLLENIRFYEGLILYYTVTGEKIFLLHGHQADFLNDTLWRFTRFLVRYVWKPLERFGVKDPTSAAKNYKKKEFVERLLAKWAQKEKIMLIAGHTHRPVFPKSGEVPYFNDGSCVHPRCITGIEIVRGKIALVKWSVKTRNDGTLYVAKEILEGPEKLENYYYPNDTESGDVFCFHSGF